MNDYERAKKIFSKARKFPRGKVKEHLDRVCGDDAALRAEVEQLLLNHLRHAPTQQGEISAPIAGDYRSGDIIDKYTIRKVLGEGGMGIVYLADQAKPIKRTVAIKVLRPGTDTKSTLNRFQAERQALAIMDHPGIAKVLDAGATEKGRPWFAMEYIKGEDLTLFCDEHRMTIRERLVLFANICDAVQHAHVKGIAHRDLKPGNILIARDENGLPQPKIIDFGIAKALSVSLSDVTDHTSIGSLVGTIKYMSPEQVCGEFDIDTRTDVYSLGVILYELIAGCGPFEWKTLQSLGEEEIRRVIRDKIPPNASTRLTSLDRGEINEIVKARNTQAPQLTRLLRRELEWIPLKALRKMRDNRYASAEAFGGDVRSYLNGHPLIAAPVTSFYRARKFLLRNKIGTGIAASFLLLLVVALLIVLGLLSETKTALTNAKEMTAKAQQEKRITSSVTNFLLDQIKEQEDREKVVNAVKYRTALDEQHPDWLPQTAATAIMGEIASFASHAGQHHEAIDLRTWIKEQGHSPTAQQEGTLHYRLGLDHLELGEYDVAKAFLGEASWMQDTQLGSNHPDTLRTASALARLNHELGRFKEAKIGFNETIQLQETNLDSPAWEEEPVEDDLWQSRYRRGLLSLDLGEFDSAEDDFEVVRDKVTEAHYGLAMLHLAQGDNNAAKGAIEAAQRKAETAQQTLRAEHALGQWQMAELRYPEAEELLADVQMRQQAHDSLGKDHPDTIRTVCLRIELMLDQHAPEALASDQDLMSKAWELLFETHNKTGDGPVERRRDWIQAELDLVQGLHGDARNQLLDILDQDWGDADSNSLDELRAKRSLGVAYSMLGDHPMANLYLKDTLKSHTELLALEHPERIRTDLCLGNAMAEEGNLAEARTKLEGVLVNLTDYPSFHPLKLRCQEQLLILTPQIPPGSSSRAEPVAP